MTNDEDYLIDLDDAAVRELESAYGISQTPTKSEGDPAPARTSASSDTSPAKSPTHDASLLRRVQDAETRLATERTRRVEAERLAHDRGTAVAITQARQAESDYHAVANALNKASSDAAMYKAAHQAALEQGDYARATDATEKLAEVNARMAQLKDGKAALEDRVATLRRDAEDAIRTPAPQPEQSADPFERFVSQPTLSPRAQAWFRAHPECAPSNDRAQYFRAMAADEVLRKQGITEASNPEEYYAKLDSHLGFSKSTDVAPTKAQTQDDVVVDTRTETKAAPVAQQATVPRVSAPVSRDSTVIQRRADGKMQVRLTREQRDIAESMGMTASAYAKRLIEAEQKGLLGRTVA